MKKKRMMLIAVAALLAGAQFVPVHRTNPADGGDVVAPAGIAAILERSCYDCHSNRTKWPWYSSVAPVSWLVAHDVNEGREHLNFSRWREYPAKDRKRLAEEAVEEVEKGAMPMKIYLLMHRSAKVDASGLENLRGWAGGERGSADGEDSR
jgi:mono/diheme cytochrome c family protein